MSAFESPWLLVDGVEGEVANFEVQCGTFMDTCRAVPRQSLDRQTGENVITYHVVQAVPSRLPYLASNVVNNLRHALDQAVNCAAMELGATKRASYFPIAKDAADLDRVIKDNCKTVPQTLIPYLKGLLPHSGGDDLLYALSRLAGRNKHQVALEMNLNLPYFNAHEVFRQVSGHATIGLTKWDGRKRQFEFARLGPDAKLECEPQARLPLFLSMPDLPLPATEPAAGAMRALLSRVRAVVGGIESETARLRSP